MPVTDNAEAVKKPLPSAKNVIVCDAKNVCDVSQLFASQHGALQTRHHNSLLLPVVLSEQILPGSFAFALNYLVDHELDPSALDAQFNNDEVGANAYDPRVMLKIVLLAYSHQSVQ